MKFSVFHKDVRYRGGGLVAERGSLASGVVLRLMLQVGGAAYREVFFEERSRIFSHGSWLKCRLRCLLTNRGRFILKYFGLSRIMFRGLARDCMILGVRKVSW